MSLSDIKLGIILGGKGLKGKIAVVLGSEGKGIRKLVLNTCDFHATIPMKGEINSLNVSATVSAMVFERLRQIST